MSRGDLESMCRTVLTKQDRLLDSIAVAAEALHRNLITEVKHVSFRRALNKLKTQARWLIWAAGLKRATVLGNS